MFIAVPSYVLHHVTPVTAGVRKAMGDADDIELAREVHGDMSP